MELPCPRHGSLNTTWPRWQQRGFDIESSQAGKILGEIHIAETLDAVYFILMVMFENLLVSVCVW